MDRQKRGMQRQYFSFDLRGRFPFQGTAFIWLWITYRHVTNNRVTYIILIVLKEDGKISGTRDKQNHERIQLNEI